jgi:hypothetical protein
VKKHVTLLLVCVFVATPVLRASTNSFNKVKLMVEGGDRQDVVLVLDDDAMVVRSEGGTVLKQFAYADIKGAEYTYAKSPRWKSAIVTSLFCIVCGVGVAFIKGKRHWMAITTEKDYMMLQLDKNNYRVILPAFEAKSDVKVERGID